MKLEARVLKYSFSILIETKIKDLEKEIKSLKFMLIKIRFPNHRHGYDFLCENLLNY